jgi:hypothetical protein
MRARDDKVMELQGAIAATVAAFKARHSEFVAKLRAIEGL